MQEGTPNWLNAQTLLRAFWIAVFLCCGAPEVWKTLSGYSIGPASAYHSTDIYGLGLLQTQNVSEQTLRALDDVPQNRPVAVLFPAGEQSEGILRYLVSYLAWPREVRPIEVTPENASRKLNVAVHSSISAIFFCQLKPPAGLQPQVKIGSGLFLVPVNENLADRRP